MQILPADQLTDAELDSALALRRALDLSLDPHLPPHERDELRAWFTSDETEYAEHRRCVAFDASGAAVGIGHIELTRDPANPAFAAVESETLGANEPCQLAMLGWLLDQAEGEGRTSILLWGHMEASTAELWPRLGAPKKYTERYSELRLDEVDAALMQRWIDRRSERASDVRLVDWDGACPDAWLPAYTRVYQSLNDIPIDDLEVADTEYSPEMMRHEERAYAAVGLVGRSLMAMGPDDEPMGLTTVLINRYRPDASWQWATVVPKRFRERGLGRWLKAEMWQRLRRDWPALTTLRTGNAESNDAMLSINVAMGYRESSVHGAWQTDLATLQAGLLRLSHKSSAPSSDVST